jgi:transposase InsO family protein
VGSRSDCDNALAEAVNAAYKAEPINRGKPWRCIDDIELSIAEWVAWHNQERLHEALGNTDTSRVRGRPYRHLTPREPANPGPRNRVGTKPV